VDGDSNSLRFRAPAQEFAAPAIAAGKDEAEAISAFDTQYLATPFMQAQSETESQDAANFEHGLAENKQIDQAQEVALEREVAHEA